MAREKFASAFACAAALSKLPFVLYHEPNSVWSFERQVTDTGFFDNSVSLNNELPGRTA